MHAYIIHTYGFMRTYKHIIIFIVSGWMVNTTAIAETHGPFKSSAGPLIVERLAGPFDHPWAIAFLPKAGSYLVTERKGNLRLVRDGKISVPVEGVPNVWASGQGGLLDVALDPNYSQNQRIFLSYSEPTGFSEARTALATGVLRLNGVKPKLEFWKVTIVDSLSKRERFPFSFEPSEGNGLSKGKGLPHAFSLAQAWSPVAARTI